MEVGFKLRPYRRVSLIADVQASLLRSIVPWARSLEHNRLLKVPLSALPCPRSIAIDGSVVALVVWPDRCFR